MKNQNRRKKVRTGQKYLHFQSSKSQPATSHCKMLRIPHFDIGHESIDANTKYIKSLQNVDICSHAMDTVHRT